MIKRIGDIILIQLSDIDSNIYILGDTVVDAGTGFNFARLHSILRSLNMNLEQFKWVVNTHCHFDHIGGNGYFLNAKIAIHEFDAPVLEKGDNEMARADFFDGKLKPRVVDRKLKEDDKIKTGRKEWRVIHTPGHTPGSICLYNKKDKTLITGDTVFADGVGRTDTPGGDPEALESSLKKLARLNVEKILPGHGEPVLKDAKKLLQDFVKS